MEFFLRPEVVVFTSVLVVVALVGVFELAATVLAGAGFSQLVDALVDVDALPDTAAAEWLFVKEMPLMVIVVTLLCGFGVTGIAAQGLAGATLGHLLPAALAYALACTGGVLSVRTLGMVFHKLKVTHTTALQPSQFIGRRATLLSETASRGDAGEAKFVDEHGQPHYVMVQPREDSVVLRQGQTVVLLEKSGASFDVAPADDKA